VLGTNRNLSVLAFCALSGCIRQELGRMDCLLLHGFVVLHCLLEHRIPLQGIPLPVPWKVNFVFVLVYDSHASFGNHTL
jgi:hypothetical protein